LSKLLVIDDDEQYRVMVKRMLEAGGHEVLDASNAATGHDLFVGEKPDLVITDILMPGTDGIELITRFIAERPDVPIIAISGGGEMPPGFVSYFFTVSWRYQNPAQAISACRTPVRRGRNSYRFCVRIGLTSLFSIS
jgi:hypothetical protein